MLNQDETQVRLKRLQTKQAIALAMEGKWKDAAEANKEIIEKFPGDVDAYNRLGRAYMELGAYAQAREAYKQALNLDPYNTIAEKNLRRLSHLGEGVAVVTGTTEKFEPKNFIEETGKAGIVNLQNPAPPEVLARVVAGDTVYLRVDGKNLIVETSLNEYIGQVDFRHKQRLIKLIEGGNRYTTNIVSSSEGSVTVIIREVYCHPSQAGQLSFPTRSEDFRIYGGDRMLRREPIEFEDEIGEESEYTGAGEEETLLEGFHDVEEKLDEER